MNKIICTKNLYNNGKCFTKDKEYFTEKPLKNNASLIDAKVKNDQNELHIIGSWWRSFRIVG